MRYKRTIGKVVLSLLVVIISATVIVVVLFHVRSIRDRGLNMALARIDSATPGRLSWREARWTAPGKITLGGVAWVHEGDTLFSADTISASIRLVPVLRRDLVAHEIRFTGITADVPAVRRAVVAAKSQGNGDVAATRAGVPVLREGALPGVPSISIGDIELSARSVVIDDEIAINGFVLAGNVDARRGRAPVARLARLVARGTPGAWRIDDASIDIDLARGAFDGRASGQITSQWPFHLSMTSPSEDMFSVTVTRRDGESPPDAVGVAVSGTVLRSGIEVSSITFKGLLRTPASADLVALLPTSRAVKGLANLEGITMALRGSLQLAEHRRAEVSAYVWPNSWLNGGVAHIIAEPNRVRIDSLALQLPGLEMRARGTSDADRIEANATVDVSGSGWLRDVLAQKDTLSLVDARGTFDLSGPRSAPRIAMRIDGQAVRQSMRIDDLRLRVERPGGSDQPAAVTLHVAVNDLLADVSGEFIRQGKEATLRLAPVFLHYRTGPRFLPPRAPPKGLVRAAGGDVSFSDIRVMGAMGDLDLRGRIASDGSGDYRLRWVWNEPPPLLTRAVPRTIENLDSLRSRWQARGPFVFEARGSARRDESGMTTRASGSFSLPGPFVYGAVFASQADINDMGVLRGEFQASATRGRQTRFDVALNLNETDWVDSAIVTIQRTGETTTINPIELGLEGVGVKLVGTHQQGEWNADLEARIDSAALIRRFIPGKDSLFVTARMQAHIAGPSSAPRIDASLAGSLRDRDVEIPTVDGSFLMREDGLIARVKATEGMSSAAARLDRFDVSYKTRTPGNVPFPGRLVFAASGEELAFAHAIDLSRESGEWIIDGDSLALSVRNQDLRSTGHFQIRFAPSSQTIAVRDLRLGGRLGTIRADGYAGPDSADFDAEAKIVVPPSPPSIRLHPGLWPASIDASLRVDRDGTVKGRLDVAGITLSDGSRPHLQLNAQGSADSLGADLELTSGSRRLAAARVRLPATLRAFPPRLNLLPGVILAEASASGMPVRIGRGEGARIARASGRVEVGGTTARPSARVDGKLAFPDWPKLSKHELVVRAEMAGGPAEQAAAKDNDTPSADEVVPQEPSSGRLTGNIVLRAPERQLAIAELSYPIDWSFAPARLATSERGTVGLRLQTERLQLSEFDGLLPANVRVEGRAQLDLAARGEVNDPVLDGDLSTQGLRVTLADGTSVSAEGNMQLGGVLSHPAVTGSIDIRNGVIRIPEPPKNLHPTEGDAALWDSTMFAGASQEGLPTAIDTDGRERRWQIRESQVDVIVRIPSGLWIRGRGLEVELSGDLQLVQKGRHPTVNGTLRARRGQLVFIGRTFFVERGSVTFHGDDEIDPSLDLVLATRLEGTVIRALFGGTAQRPEFTLSSEPEMPEGDIISFLLFGRPVDELSHDQVDLLQQRANDLVTTFGLVQLEARLSRQLGVDMIRIRRATADEKKKSLVLGKYISRRVLVTYEQILEDQANFMLNLEYFLGRNFKIDTLLGSQNQSGIEIDWSREY